MSQEIRDQIYKNFAEKQTEELLEIWQKNDRIEWSNLAFEVLEELLKKRIKNIPVQDEPITEYQEDEILEEWEKKLLDKSEQPELYDVLEVLNLKDNIEKLAKAVVIIYIVLSITNLQFFREMLQGYVPSLPSPDKIPGLLWELFLTVATTALRIALIYFPLKALSYILRILMEMEFNSRNAK